MQRCGLTTSSICTYSSNRGATITFTGCDVLAFDALVKTGLTSEEIWVEIASTSLGSRDSRSRAERGLRGADTDRRDG